MNFDVDGWEVNGKADAAALSWSSPKLDIGKADGQGA